MKFLLSGYYGFQNVGDEAVLDAIVQGIALHFPGSEISVLSASPEETNKQYKVKAFDRYSISAILGAILQNDVLISGGGTLFQDTTSGKSFLYYFAIILAAKLLRKKTVFFAQGFGPLKGKLNRWLAKIILNRVDLITLRDEDSHKMIRKLGCRNRSIFVTADPAALLRSEDKKAGKKLLALEAVTTDKPILGISVRNIPHHPGLEDKVFASLAAKIDQLVNDHGYRPLFLLMHGAEDLVYVKKVTQRMKAEATTLFRLCRPDEMAAIVARLDLLIGMRLHALIFAATHSVPLLGLSYDPKVESFMRSIRQPFIRLDSKFNEQEFDSEINAIIENKEAIKTSLEVVSNQLYHKAELNFSLLEALIVNAGETVEFAGVKVDNVTINAALQKFNQLMAGGPGLIVTPNPEMIVASQRDYELKRIINSAGLRVPDGISMVVVSRLLGFPLKERVTGIDLMLNIVGISAKNGYRIFLLGGEPGIAEEAEENLVKRFPGLKITGTHNGYFSDKEAPEVINKIKGSETDILFAGLGAGRQEKWLNRHLKDLNIRVGMCIGGSMDVISGRKKRAPLWIQKLYIEWLYRLVTEPQRWKRQIALPKFLWLMFFSRR